MCAAVRDSKHMDHKISQRANARLWQLAHKPKTPHITLSEMDSGQALDQWTYKDKDITHTRMQNICCEIILQIWIQNVLFIAETQKLVGIRLYRGLCYVWNDYFLFLFWLDFLHILNMPICLSKFWNLLSDTR